MIDHIFFSVSDFAASKEFYKQALKPLGYRLDLEINERAGFGVNGKPDFWIRNNSKTTPKLHVALKCKTRAEVDAFYEAALAAGAQDNGAPGLRTIYHPNYYSAFVLDPDGHNIEAVCHEAVA